MIKRALTIVLLLTLGAVTGMAVTITETFSSVGAATIDITSTIFNFGVEIPNAAWTDLNNGMRFSYEDFGDRLGNGYATVTSAGIQGVPGTGGLNGLLIITFTNPSGGNLQQTGFAFPFLLLPAATYTDGALWFLNDVPGGGGTSNSNFTDAFGVGIASANDITATFNEVQVYFSLFDTLGVPSAGFQVSSVSGFSPDAPSVPEPGTYGLLGSGLLMLGFGSRKLMKRRA